MAATIRNVTFSVLRIRRQSLRNGHAVAVTSRLMSSTSNSPADDETEANPCNTKTPMIAMSSNERTIICWHPEPEFPYEHTKPLPRKIDEVQEGESVLKVQLLQQDLYRYRRDGPTSRDLTNMFHTTKHQWYPAPQKKYRKPFPPKDRDGV